MSVEKIIQLKAGEEILCVVHEDPAPHLPVWFLIFIWSVLPFFLIFPLFKSGLAGVVFFILWVFSAIFFAGRAFYKWSRTLFIVTDRRVIDIDQRGLFDRTVSEVVHERIDDVSYRVHGFFPTLFRYGAVRLHIRGAGTDIEFCRVRSPARLHDLINDVRDTTSH